MSNIRKAMTYDKLSDKIIVPSATDGESRVVSLLGWVREVLLEAATRSFFGDKLLEIDPDLFQSFFDFDDNSWKLTYHLPHVFSREMYAAKQKACSALSKYFQLPAQERPGAAWLIQTLEGEMKHLGIQDSDIASFAIVVKLLISWIESMDANHTSWIRYFTWVSKSTYLSQYYFKAMHENNGHTAEQREKSPDNSILNLWDSIHISFIHLYAPLTPLFVMYTCLRKRFFRNTPLEDEDILYYLYTHAY